MSPQTVKLLMQLGYDIKGVAEAGLKGCEMAFFGRLTAAKLRYRTLHSDEYCVGVYSFCSHRNVHHILGSLILMVAQ